MAAGRPPPAEPKGEPAEPGAERAARGRPRRGEPPANNRGGPASASREGGPPLKLGDRELRGGAKVLGERVYRAGREVVKRQTEQFAHQVREMRRLQQPRGPLPPLAPAGVPAYGQLGAYGWPAYGQPLGYPAPAAGFGAGPGMQTYLGVDPMQQYGYFLQMYGQQYGPQLLQQIQAAAAGMQHQLAAAAGQPPAAGPPRAEPAAAGAEKGKGKGRAAAAPAPGLGFFQEAGMPYMAPGMLGAFMAPGQSGSAQDTGTQVSGFTLPGAPSGSAGGPGRAPGPKQAPERPVPAKATDRPDLFRPPSAERRGRKKGEEGVGESDDTGATPRAGEPADEAAAPTSAAAKAAAPPAAAVPAKPAPVKATTMAGKKSTQYENLLQNIARPSSKKQKTKHLDSTAQSKGSGRTAKD